MTATLKSKQTAIATVRNNLRTLASFPTTLIFHWSLPLKNLRFWVGFKTFANQRATIFATSIPDTMQESTESYKVA
jgi:hypothetical protein